MNKHRVRITELSGDPIPVLWVEIEKDSWLQLSIDMTAEDNLHELLHEFLSDIYSGNSFPITYDSRAFNIYPNLQDYKESFIE